MSSDSSMSQLFPPWFRKIDYYLLHVISISIVSTLWIQSNTDETCHNFPDKLRKCSFSSIQNNFHAYTSQLCIRSQDFGIRLENHHYFLKTKIICYQSNPCLELKTGFIVFLTSSHNSQSVCYFMCAFSLSVWFLFCGISHRRTLGLAFST